MIYHWRNALVLGAVFVVTGLVYLFLQGNGEWMYRAGVVMLSAVGGAMAFTFFIFLRCSREL